MQDQVTVNGHTYRLQSTTGKVLNASKNMETIVRGGGGGGATYKGTGGTAPVHISSTTIVHDQFFLEDTNGQEHSFQLSGFDLACREGNVLTVAWAIKQGRDKGPYVAITNHTTQKNYFNNDAIRSLCKPGILVYILAVLGTILLAFLLENAILGVAVFVVAVAAAIIFQVKTNVGIKVFKAAF